MAVVVMTLLVGAAAVRAGTVHVKPTDTYYDGSDGTLFPEIPLPAGATQMMFEATRAIETAGSGSMPASPDGLDINGNAPFNFTNTRFSGTYQGTPVGSTTGIDPALFGVFFNPNFTGTPADSENFRSDATPDLRILPSYSPSVNQPFFIGDGFTNNDPLGVPPSGTQQVFNIPIGAKFLLLGIGADIVLSDNFGPGFDVTITSNAVPEPSSLVLLGLGILGLSSYARRVGRRWPG
jgi:hypothetical protein